MEYVFFQYLWLSTQHWKHLDINQIFPPTVCMAGTCNVKQLNARGEKGKWLNYLETYKLLDLSIIQMFVSIDTSLEQNANLIQVTHSVKTLLGPSLLIRVQSKCTNRASKSLCYLIPAYHPILICCLFLLNVLQSNYKLCTNLKEFMFFHNVSMPLLYAFSRMFFFKFLCLINFPYSHPSLKTMFK